MSDHNNLDFNVRNSRAHRIDHGGMADNPPAEHKQQEDGTMPAAWAATGLEASSAQSAPLGGANSTGTSTNNYSLPLWAFQRQHQHQSQQQQEQRAFLQALLAGGNPASHTTSNSALQRLLLRQGAAPGYYNSASALMIREHREQEAAMSWIGLQPQMQHQQHHYPSLQHHHNPNLSVLPPLRTQQPVLSQQQHLHQQQLTQAMLLGHLPSMASSAASLPSAPNLASTNPFGMFSAVNSDTSRSFVTGRSLGSGAAASVVASNMDSFITAEASSPISRTRIFPSIAGAQQPSASVGTFGIETPFGRTGDQTPASKGTATDAKQRSKSRAPGKATAKVAAGKTVAYTKHDKPVRKKGSRRSTGRKAGTTRDGNSSSSSSTSQTPPRRATTLTTIPSLYSKTHVRPIPPDIPMIPQNAASGTPPLLLPHDQRTVIPLATDEDACWLSEFQCYLRANVLEICRATPEDVKVRNNSKHLVAEQIGLRCRFCAHLPPHTRARRSSAFPSSLGQVYQSVTMMVRDHIPACPALPKDVHKALQDLQTASRQGASDSKHYWVHAAKAIGLTDQKHSNVDGNLAEGASGLEITEESRVAASRLLPFGALTANPPPPASAGAEESPFLVHPTDLQDLDSGGGSTGGDTNIATKTVSLPLLYWYTLLRQVQTVHLTASERVGNRKSLPVGLPGMGCRYCCAAGRWGMSRVFPARRRTLPSKLPDLYGHLRRCTLCPIEIKEELERMHQQVDRQRQQARQANQSGGTGTNDNFEATSMTREREFFSRVWSRLGHGNRGEPAATVGSSMAAGIGN